MGGLLALGLLVRLPLFPVYGFQQDFLFFSSWASYLTDHPVSTIYHDPKIFTYNLINYPPVFIYILAFLGRGYRLFFSGPLENRIFLCFLKSFVVLCEVGTAWILYRFALSRWDRKTALRVAGLYFLNPAMLYNSVYYGQVDSIFAFLVLAALVFLLQERYFLCGSLSACAVLMKIQTIPFLALFCFVPPARRQARKIIPLGIGLLATGFFLLLPYLLAGTAREVWIRCVRENILWGKYITVGAFNLWYLFADPTTLDDRIWGWCFGADGQCRAHVVIRYLTYKNLGTFLLGAGFLWVVYRTWKEEAKDLWSAAAHVALAFFLLPTKVHERYLYPFFMFYAPLTIGRPFRTFLFGAFSLTYLANLAVICPIIGKMRDVAEIDSALGVGVAAVNLIIYAWFLGYEYAVPYRRERAWVMLGKIFAYAAIILVAVLWIRCETRMNNPAVLYLSRLEPVAFRQDWPEIKNPKVWDLIGRDLSTDKRQLQIGHTLYRYGLGAHSNSVIDFDIPGSYTRFESWAGVDAEVWPAYESNPTLGTVTFEVWVNGEKQYESPLTLPTTPPRPISVSLPRTQGVNRLTLVARNGGDWNNGDHADWALARVERTYLPVGDR